jgi:hypothetical protein
VSGDTTSGLDVATAIVAGYAAIVATLGLGFQMVSWLLGWQTRVHVRVIPKMMVTNATGPNEAAVVFKLVNRSSHPVKITHLGMDPLKKGGPHIMFPQPLPLPVAGTFEIPPRDAVTVWQPPTSFKDGDPDWKTRARATTSDDKTFKSKRLRVRDLMEDAKTRS